MKFHILGSCSGTEPMPGRHHTSLALELEDPSMYVQEQYMRERSVEFLSTERNGSPVIEALLEGGRKHRYTFTEI